MTAVAIPDNVRVGEGATVCTAATFRLYRSTVGVTLGAHSWTDWGSTFDLGPDGSLEIGEFSGTFGTIIASNGRIVIGRYVMISYDVVIADSEFGRPGGEPDAVLPDPVVSIGDDCWIGLGAVILPGTRLGQGVIVGAHAVVGGDIPDYAIVAGNPGRIVGWAT